ncbi:hemagglutinin repeat-containing protein [Sporomusa sphaeroides]|uniref:Adenosine monophosphate-protein transferase and cysteine protease IbpA n=1 Tax=Sporomusa sphaeroides DSM 2875 TaxID=1337886 RepID=A0ABP2CA98_9FIRM|nr:hemagglutinin repeat-containing protein [Sporomusa sphaeroides]OLS55684.1 adenosine monophosphate-protein transferase and cysteine protease IbpA precursor [Sporomusa sphaeroides DSM 2875]CVK19390.1 Adenosine monophosphate-protein transferase and cysteine protease IbpA precursor [Sporomusa sphaeroides DSM 2875]
MKFFSSGKSKPKTLVAWLTLVLFSLQPALTAAQVIVDANAPNAHRPTIDTAQNGTTVVQIAKPSAAGVSRNLYQQFDITQNGLILNNSYKLSKTQLAGYIQGNANLAGGSARIILNEVTGHQISHLRGYLEVAGQRADVIIANRNGIVGNGFGFINTNRGVLTTGTPVFGGGGSLEAFRVTGGHISVEGDGVNASEADRVDLISRAVTVNAGIWAQELNAITGSNQVDYNTLHTHTITGEDTQPLVALDVSALGGMYANKIKLVGTEQGVGVNSQGTLSANSGSLTLTNEGKITLAGTTSASGSVQIYTGESLINTGILYAQNNMKITGGDIIENSGTMAAARNTDLTAQRVSSSGTLGAGVDNRGTVTNTGNLNISASNTLQANGQNIAGGNIVMNASDIDLSSAKTYAGNRADLTAVLDNINNIGGTLQVADTLTITANGAVTNDKSASNTASEINAGQLIVLADSISNKGGKLTQYGVDATTIKTVNGIDNTGGNLATNGSSLTINANSLTNREQGSITADGAMSITVSGNIDNNQGIVETRKGLTVNTQFLANQGGTIANLDSSGLTLTVTGDVQNDDGYIGGNGQVGVNANKLSNVSGKVTAKSDLTITTSEGIDNTLGNLSAEQDVIVTQSASPMNNRQGIVGAGHTLSVVASEVDNTSGTMSSGENATLAVDKISGAGEVMAGQNLTIHATGGFTNEAGNQLKANRDISVTAIGEISNQGTLEAVRNLTISGSKIINDAGAAMIANHALTLNATGDIQNRGDIIGNKVTLTGNRIANDGNKALIVAVDLNGADIDPLKKAELNLYAATSLENKDDASIYSQGNLNIAGSAEKDGNGQFAIKTSNVLNQSANIEADGDIIISANELRNKLKSVTWEERTISETKYDQKGIHTDSRYPNLYGISLGLEEKLTTAKRLTPGFPSVWLLSETVSEKIVKADSSISRLVSGQNIFLDTLLINNEYSVIVAAKELNTVIGATVNNTALGNQRMLRRQLVYADVRAYLSDREFRITDDRYRSLGMGWFRSPAFWHNGVIGQGYTDTITEQLPGGIAAVFSGNQKITIQGSVNNSVVAPGSVNGTNHHALLPSASTGPISNPQTNHSGTIVLPQNGMYTVQTEPTARYLVETNPRFASYKNFITSDYMLQQLNIDPATTMKRLGDGYYEQKLVREQITSLTGRVYLPGYDNAEAQYKALLENGATYAKAFNLQVGIALTAVQMAQLTSDIVWLVEQEVNGQKVLVPVVYLTQANATSLHADGAIITGDRVIITGDTVNNSGTIKAIQSATIDAHNVNNIGGTINGGQDTTISATEDITNISGVIAGNNINLNADRDIKSETFTSTTELPFLLRTSAGNTASIIAGENLIMEAGRDIAVNGTNLKAGSDIAADAGRDLTIGTIQTQERMTTGSRYLEDTITNVVSNIEAGNNITMTSQQDATLSGAQVNAGEDLTLTSLAGNINISAVKDEELLDKKVGTSRNWKRTRTDDETVIGSTLQAGGNVNITAVNPETPTANGGNITIAGSHIYSDNGKISIEADQDVTIQEVKEKHESLVQTHRKKKGTFSSKTTDTLDYALVNEVQGSTLSGDSVTINSGKDLTVKGSNVIGTNDIILHADDNITLTSAQETGKEEHYKRVKKSGLFSGGGLGFTIGKQTQTTTLNEQVKAEVGSTVGSLAGNVTVTAGNDVNSAGTLIASGNDTNITGKNVTIDNTTNTYDSQYKYEFKQSGLSVSLGGTVVDLGTNLAHDINRAGDVQDNRLQALYGFKAQQDLKKLGDKLEGNFKDDLSINVSIGTSKTKFEQNTHVETVNTSNITAGGDVTITGTAGDVNLKATNINAHDVTLDAAKNLNIGSAQNVSQTDTKTSSSSASLGASFGLSGTFNGITGSVGASKGKENQSTTTNTESVINADGTATLKSGDDTNIIGSQITGEKVVANVGGNLTIISKQDSETYTEKTKGGNIGFGTGKISGTHGSIGTGKINSDYNSVIDQAGIFAGEDGFDIHVGKNTDLKGSVISSEATPDKNKISTDTLTWMDLHNKAKYSSSSMGVGYAAGKDANGKDIEKKNKGLTPNIGVTASGEAESTTQSAISPGTIEVRSNPNQDLSGLSRDTSNTLNALGKIFDKQTVQEQQELAGLFGEEVFKAIGNLGLPEGSLEKITLDAFAGGLMAKLGGGSFASGAAGAAFNQIVINELANIKDPALMQWASAVLGAAAAKVVGGSAQTGASTAVSETKNNYLSHWQKEERAKQLAACEKIEDPEERQKAKENIEKYWTAVDYAQDEIMDPLGISESTLKKMDPKERDRIEQFIASKAQEMLTSSSSDEVLNLRKIKTWIASVLPGFGTAIAYSEGDLAGAGWSFVGDIVPGEKVATKLLSDGTAIVMHLADDGGKLVVKEVEKITSASSRKLGDNLVAAGVERPDYASAAHHIVAGNSVKANEARAILQKYGIDIDDAANGVFLPTVKDVSNSAYHPSLHTNAYYEKVTNLLQDVTTKEEALDILNKISNQLKNGTFMN